MQAAIMAATLATPINSYADTPKPPGIQGYDTTRGYIKVEFHPIPEDILTAQVSRSDNSNKRSPGPPAHHNPGRPQSNNSPHISLGGSDRPSVTTTKKKKKPTDITTTVTLPPKKSSKTSSSSSSSSSTTQQPDTDIDEDQWYYETDSGEEIILPPEVTWEDTGDPNTVSLSSMDIDFNAPLAEQVVELAETQLGVPYVWGGNAWGSGLDCSGLVQQTYSRVGVNLPRTTYDQINAGNKIPLTQADAGDYAIVSGGGHVVILSERLPDGDFEVIHAPQPGDVVKKSRLSYFPVDAVIRVL